MKAASSMIGATLLAVLCCNAPAKAGVRPYVRVEYGGNEFLTKALDDNIAAQQRAFKNAGVASDLKGTGSGYGPGAAAGLWLLPGFRIGATYSYAASHKLNIVHKPGVVFLWDSIDFKLGEIGGEAVLRIPHGHGIMIGGNACQAHVEFTEDQAFQTLAGDDFSWTKAKKDHTTNAAFVGYDQTNDKGGAGFVRAGYAWRDIGAMSSNVLGNQGGPEAAFTSTTVDMDLSGWFLKVGLGFDLGR